MLLIFWAYAGFELSVLPAAEVYEPQRTLPRGLITGMAVATTVYLLTASSIVIALPWQDAAASVHPVSDAAVALFAGLGWPLGIAIVVMTMGALVSISSVFDVFTLGVARLSYALAADGLFPGAFARLHPRYETPYMGILFQAAIALIGSLLFDLSGLMASAVFFLGVCYTLTALAALRLVHQHPTSRLHVPMLRPLLALASLAGIYLSAQAPLWLIVTGGGVLFLTAVGIGARRAQRATGPLPLASPLR